MSDPPAMTNIGPSTPEPAPIAEAPEVVTHAPAASPSAVSSSSQKAWYTHQSSVKALGWNPASGLLARIPPKHPLITSLDQPMSPLRASATQTFKPLASSLVFAGTASSSLMLTAT